MLKEARLASGISPNIWKLSSKRTMPGLVRREGPVTYQGSCSNRTLSTFPQYPGGIFPFGSRQDLGSEKDRPCTPDTFPYSARKLHSRRSLSFSAKENTLKHRTVILAVILTLYSKRFSFKSTLLSIVPYSCGRKVLWYLASL